MEEIIANARAQWWAVLTLIVCLMIIIWFWYKSLKDMQEQHKEERKNDWEQHRAERQATELEHKMERDERRKSMEKIADKQDQTNLAHVEALHRISNALTENTTILKRW